MKQIFVFEDQIFFWAKINARVSKWSILCRLLFLIYTNCLSSNVKLFAGDTFLFSVTHDSNASASELSSDLWKINYSTFQRKTSFCPDRKKQTQEVIFSRKLKKSIHPSWFLITVMSLKLIIKNIRGHFIF